MKTQIARRLIFGLMALAALFMGWQMLQNYFVDPDDKGHVNTAGWIVAIENDGAGDHAVLFNSEGAKIEAPGKTEEAFESEVAWRPDGDRLLFLANREGRGYRPYRWNPGNNSAQPRFPASTISMSALSYGPFVDEDANANALLVAGGIVAVFDQRNARKTQILPPQSEGRTVGEDAEGQQGATGQIAGVYADLGDAFTEAKWGENRGVIFATMKRTNGEVLLVQQLGLDSNGKLFAPVPLAAGDEIQMDVSKDGACIASIRNFQWVDPNSPEIPTEFRKEGKVTTPFKNVTFMIRFNTVSGTPQMQTVFAAQGPEHMMDPSFMPDGKTFLASVGRLNDAGQFVPEAVLNSPAEEGGVQRATPVYVGVGRMPSASPDGSKVVFVGRDSSKRTVLMVVGVGQTAITTIGEPGEYKWPRFSPQSP